MDSPVEWFAAFWGVLGSVIVASNTRWSAWGFPCYAISNAAWVWFGLHHGLPGVVTMNLVFFGTTAFGLWRWFRKPRPTNP